MSHHQDQSHLPKLCLICKDMYGHPDFKDMCSKCFKEIKVKKQKTELDQLSLLKKETKDQLQLNSQEHQQKSEFPSLIVEKNENKLLTPMAKFQELAKQKQEKLPKKDRSRCNNCNKKVGMLGYECKHCTQTFCKFHRLPQEHECNVDFISLGKKKLQEQNPVVDVIKIQKI